MKESTSFLDLLLQGNAAIMPPEKSRGIEKMIQQDQTAKRTTTEAFRMITDQAKKELGYEQFGTPESPIMVKKRAATGGHIDLRTHRIDVPEQPVWGERALRPGMKAAKAYDIPVWVAENSRVAQAGARIIVVDDAPPISTGPVIAWQQQAGAFVLVETAKFHPVADGEEATASGLSDFTHSSPIIWGDEPSAAFRTTISRRDRCDRSYDSEQVVMDAVLLGLAREADRVLLAAIVAARAGETFVMARAAEQGLKWGELRAICGGPTGGYNESRFKINAGQLYYMSVPCEFTDTVPHDVIGAFNRAAVAIHPLIRVTAERLNAQGELTITVFANLLPLLPRPEVFWL